MENAVAKKRLGAPECVAELPIAKEQLELCKLVYPWESVFDIQSFKEATASFYSLPLVESVPACCMHLFVSDPVKLCNGVSSRSPEQSPCRVAGLRQQQRWSMQTNCIAWCGCPPKNSGNFLGQHCISYSLQHLLCPSPCLSRPNSSIVELQLPQQVLNVSKPVMSSSVDIFGVRCLQDV